MNKVYGIVMVLQAAAAFNSKISNLGHVWSNYGPDQFIGDVVYGHKNFVTGALSTCVCGDVSLH